MINPKKFHISLGERGEMIAWGYLSRQGYKILEKNYRCPLGEIDVVAEKDGRIIFVEVKTRSQERFGRPEESVTEQKQHKLVKLAQWYLKATLKDEKPVSFHVVAVQFSPDRDPEVKIIENAFVLGGE